MQCLPATTLAPAKVGFEDKLRSIIKLVTDAKRVPILPRIPWNTVGTYLAEHPQSSEARTAIHQAYANALLPLYPSH